jgi:hypothetical protein
MVSKSEVVQEMEENNNVYFYLAIKNFCLKNTFVKLIYFTSPIPKRIQGVLQDLAHEKINLKWGLKEVKLLFLTEC